MTAPTATGIDRALRTVVLLAGLAVTARWEHQYGVLIGLGPLAWAIPVLTAGYLTLAIRRDRDVPVALAAATASTLVGALSSTLTIPAPVLAAGTASLVAVIAYRAHAVLTLPPVDRTPRRARPVAVDVIDRTPAAAPPDPRPVELEASDRHDPDPRPVADTQVLSPRGIARRIVVDTASADLTDRAVRDRIAQAVTAAGHDMTRDAVRALHRRVVDELEGGQAA